MVQSVLGALPRMLPGGKGWPALQPQPADCLAVYNTPCSLMCTHMTIYMCHQDVRRPNERCDSV